MKNFKSILLLVLFPLFEAGRCAERLETPFLDELKSVSKAQNKKAFEDRYLKFLDKVKKLSEKKKKALYSSIVESMDLISEDPFSDSDKWIVVGALLLHTKSEDLIYDILIRTPPPRVGFVSLEEFMKKIPFSVLAKVIKNGANERAELQKKLSSSEIANPEE